MSKQESTTDDGVARTDSTPGTGTKTCVTCGVTIDQDEWFPIRGRTDDDGEFRIYSFCGEDCVESWEDS